MVNATRSLLTNLVKWEWSIVKTEAIEKLDGEDPEREPEDEAG